MIIATYKCARCNTHLDRATPGEWAESMFCDQCGREMSGNESLMLMLHGLLSQWGFHGPGPTDRFPEAAEKLIAFTLWASQELRRHGVKPKEPDLGKRIYLGTSSAND